MAAIGYENVPVFRSSNFNSPDDIVGTAVVAVSEGGKATIVMEVNAPFTDFLELGELKALYLSGFVSGVDSEKAKEYWSRQQ